MQSEVPLHLGCSIGHEVGAGREDEDSESGVEVSQRRREEIRQHLQLGSMGDSSGFGRGLNFSVYPLDESMSPVVWRCPGAVETVSFLG